MTNGRQAWRVDGSRGVSPLCVEADACIGPLAGLAEGWRLSVAARLRVPCRASDFARRGALRHRGFPGRCKHRPLRNRDKVLPGFAEYFRRHPAMHPSVCALRRRHRPVCGARIARRALKHACALRPLHYREAVKTGAVSEGRSYAFYRRTGDNKRSDGRLPHEKQLSPPQAALDSAAPCRGGFWGNCCPEGAPSRWTFREAARSKLSPAKEFWGNCSPPRGHRRAVILASPG